MQQNRKQTMKRIKTGLVISSALLLLPILTMGDPYGSVCSRNVPNWRYGYKTRLEDGCVSDAGCEQSKLTTGSSCVSSPSSESCMDLRVNAQIYRRSGICRVHPDPEGGKYCDFSSSDWSEYLWDLELVPSCVNFSDIDPGVIID
jgi:hypothetical protein